jgi:pimeloyl-ACP methyl ester carboxylesterase
METFAEDCYFMTGPTATGSGYNVMTVDLLGQGVNTDQGLFLEARPNIPLKAAIDYVLARSETDPDRLAMFGFSWGGHIVLKGAQNEPRLKALIANPATYDIYGAARAQQSGSSRGDPVSTLVFEKLAWRFGLKISVFFPRMVKAFEYLLYAKANCKQIRCPTLCMAGEGEARIALTQTRECFRQLPNPKKKLAILTKVEGGEAHCQVNNLGLLNQVIFDWLDEVFLTV